MHLTYLPIAWQDFQGFASGPSTDELTV